MAAIISEVRDRLSYTIAEAKAQLIAPDSWSEAQGHAAWVEEVWANYISNAIKYGGEPPIVELGADETVKGVVRFWARDNGPGLTEEERGKLFEEFSRLQPSRGEGC